MPDARENNLVSVVIPTYNHLDYVDETLESVTRQTYSDLEIIICDDCSIDGTIDKILDWAKRDKRIVAIFSEKNEGLSVNLNKGLDRARGEFLSILGGDDRMALTKIEEQLHYLKDNPDFDVVLHWVEVFESESGKTMRIIDSNIMKSPVDWFAPKVSFGISKKNNNSSFPPTSYLARSSYALHSRYDYRLKYKNEVLFAIDNYMNKPGAKWHCIPKVLGYYRIHEANMHRSKEMIEALLEETYVNYALASARYPSLKIRLRRRFQYFIYQDLYHLYLQADLKQTSAVKFAKYRFKKESSWLLYYYAMAFLKAKLLYLKIRSKKYFKRSWSIISEQ